MYSCYKVKLKVFSSRGVESFDLGIYKHLSNARNHWALFDLFEAYVSAMDELEDADDMYVVVCVEEHDEFYNNRKSDIGYIDTIYSRHFSVVDYLDTCYSLA